MNQSNVPNESLQSRSGIHASQWWCDCTECELRCHESLAFQLELHRAMEAHPPAWMVECAKTEIVDLHRDPQDSVRNDYVNPALPRGPRVGSDGSYCYQTWSWNLDQKEWVRCPPSQVLTSLFELNFTFSKGPGPPKTFLFLTRYPPLRFGVRLLRTDVAKRKVLGGPLRACLDTFKCNLVTILVHKLVWWRQLCHFILSNENWRNFPYLIVAIKYLLSLSLNLL